MHGAAYQYVKRFESKSILTVVEIGSRDVNSTERGMLLRHLFPNAQWTGVDLYKGHGVDVVANAIDWRPPEPVDLVICCEVLEHCEQWEDLINAASDMLKLGGHFIMTCAGPGRVPHSAIDGGQLRQDEYYGNLSPRQIGIALFHAWLACIHIEAAGNDTRCCAVNCGISKGLVLPQDESLTAVNTEAAEQPEVTATFTEDMPTEQPGQPTPQDEATR